jgi:hypothetical protein
MPDDKSPPNHATTRIDKENEFVHHRVSWLLTSQSIFCGAYAVGTWQKPAPEFLPWLAKLGLMSSILISISIWAAVVAIYHFRRNQKDSLGHWTFQTLGLIAPMLLPLMFIAVWILLVKEAAWMLGGGAATVAVILTTLIWAKLAQEKSSR